MLIPIRARVNGLVLVDASTEDETTRLDRATGGKYGQAMAAFAALATTCRDATKSRALVPGNERFGDCLRVAPTKGLTRALAAAIRSKTSILAGAVGGACLRTRQ